MQGTALIVGAERYAGRCAIRTLLERSRLHLILAVDSPQHVASLRAWLAGQGAPSSRISWCLFDLEQREPFAPRVPRNVNYIVHCATLSHCGAERARAERVNVDGTHALLAYASTLPDLRRVLLVGSVYASGLTNGAVLEAPCNGRAGFANHLEWSYWSAEQLALQFYSQLPLTIMRLPIILTDGESGHIQQNSALHELLRLCHAGLLPLIPGRAETPVHMIDGDFVRDAMRALLHESAPPGIYHVTHAASSAPTLIELLECAFDVMERDAAYRRRGSRRPMLVSQASFDQLVHGSAWVLSARHKRVFSCLVPFAPQLYLSKSFDNRRLCSVLPEGRRPNVETQLRTVVTRMIAPHGEPARTTTV